MTGGPPTMREAPSFRKRCGVCRRSYDGVAWEALAPVDTLPAAAVQPHLAVHAEFAVTLRRCTCGSVLAVRSNVR